MLNSYKKIKHIFKLTALLSLFSFTIIHASIVTSDDGGAFVTKREFDTLRGNFDTQLSQYDYSIGSKIEGAISSYLAGLKLTNIPINYWNMLLDATNNKFVWLNKTIDAGTDGNAMVNDVNVDITRSYHRKECNLRGEVRCVENSPGSFYSGAGLTFRVYPTEKSGTDYLLEVSKKNQGLYIDTFTAWTSKPWTSITAITSKNASNSWNRSEHLTDGAGRLWELNVLPNGKYELSSYYSSAYLYVTTNISANTYKDFYYHTNDDTSKQNIESIYTSENGMDDTTTINVNIQKGNKLNVTPAGERGNDDENWIYGEQNIVWSTISDGVDYQYVQFGTGTEQGFYCMSDNATIDYGSSDEYMISGTGTGNVNDKYTFIRAYYPFIGPQNEDAEVSDINFSFYNPKYIPEYYSLNQIENKYISNVAGTLVFHGEGAPAFLTVGTETNTALNNITLSVTDLNGNPVSGRVRLMFSLNKFSNGEFANDEDKLYDQIINVSNTGTTISPITLFVQKKNALVYVNMYDVDNERFIKMSEIDLSIA